MPSCLPDELSDEELLAAVAGSDRVRDVLSRYPVQDLAVRTADELRTDGLTPSAARRLACAFEIGRRASTRPLRRGQQLRSSREVFEAFHLRLRHVNVERFLAVHTSAKNHVLREVLVSQ